MGLKSVRVVRVGHRYVRDYRTLTHLCLVSRALGAEAIYLEEVEKELEQTVKSKLGEDLTANPANRNLDASAFIGTALVHAFPCAAGAAPRR